jgi:hypothetical protein
VTQGDVEVRKLLGLIHARRASIDTYLRKIRPVSNRLTNISIIGTAITAALMAGPAFGGVPFAKAVQNGLPFFADSSGVWRMLCFAALIVSVVTAISVNLNKSHNLSSRISTAEACNVDLEGLSALIEFGELSVKDGVKVYRQLISKIPFIEENPVIGDQAYPFDTGASPADYSRDQATLNRQWTNAAFTIMVLAALVLLIAVVGLIAGLGRRTAGSSPPGISAPAVIRVGSRTGAAPTSQTLEAIAFPWSISSAIL